MGLLQEAVPQSFTTSGYIPSEAIIREISQEETVRLGYWAIGVFSMNIALLLFIYLIIIGEFKRNKKIFSILQIRGKEQITIKILWLSLQLLRVIAVIIGSFIFSFSFLYLNSNNRSINLRDKVLPAFITLPPISVFLTPLFSHLLLYFLGILCIVIVIFSVAISRIQTDPIFLD
jgi:hypothetical protein